MPRKVRPWGGGPFISRHGDSGTAAGLYPFNRTHVNTHVRAQRQLWPEAPSGSLPAEW